MLVPTAEEARTAVRMLKERGVDFIKVHDRTPRDAYFAIAEEARRLDLPFAGHLPRGVAFEEAAAAGQRSIEHLAGMRIYTQCSGGDAYSQAACSSFFTSLARSTVWHTPTLVSWRNMFTIGTALGDAEADHLTFASPTLREFLSRNQEFSNVTRKGALELRAASDTAAVAVSDMNRAGVGILTGCDGMVPGFCVHDELALLVQGGMSPREALQAATVNPARYLRHEQDFGAVAVGMEADLVLLDANPLADIRAVRQVHAVVLRGQLFEKRELDAILERASREFQSAAVRSQR